MRSVPVVAFTAALAASIGVARAEHTEESMFSFDGYGTFGVVHSDEDRADFRSSIVKPDGAGFSHDWSFDVDSLIAGQVTATPDSDLLMVLQVVAEQDHDDSYQPQVEWANVRYQINSNGWIRGGRIVLPTFLVSDHRKVGFANPWVRPPVEVYGLVPVTRSDGIDAGYRLRAGQSLHSLHVIAGSTEIRLPDDNEAEANDSWGITYTLEHRAATVRATYHRADLEVESFRPLFDGFRRLGPGGVAIAERYDPDEHPLVFASIGGHYDPGRWFVMAELGVADSDSALGERSGWYLSGGYRFGNFTPYLTYARTRPHGRTADPGLDSDSLPPPQAALAENLNAALNDLLGSRPGQRTLSIGGRWDLKSNVAFTLQFDHIRLDRGSAGTLTNIQPGFRPGGEVNVVSAALDFVF